VYVYVYLCVCVCVCVCVSCRVTSIGSGYIGSIYNCEEGSGHSYLIIIALVFGILLLAISNQFNRRLDR
jgi:hypothetical protein